MESDKIKTRKQIGAYRGTVQSTHWQHFAQKYISPSKSHFHLDRRDLINVCLIAHKVRSRVVVLVHAVVVLVPFSIFCSILLEDENNDRHKGSSSSSLVVSSIFCLVLVVVVVVGRDRFKSRSMSAADSEACLFNDELLYLVSPNF